MKYFWNNRNIQLILTNIIFAFLTNSFLTLKKSILICQLNKKIQELKV